MQSIQRVPEAWLRPSHFNVVGQDCASITYICYAMSGYGGPTGNGTRNGSPRSSLRD
jgi:hypothetical protein